MGSAAFPVLPRSSPHTPSNTHIVGIPKSGALLLGDPVLHLVCAELGMLPHSVRFVMEKKQLIPSVCDS
jgi:hypothetical protein